MQSPSKLKQNICPAHKLETHYNKKKVRVLTLPQPVSADKIVFPIILTLLTLYKYKR